MKYKTEQTLLEQLKITELEIENRKQLLSLSEADFELLASFAPVIDRRINRLVDDFYGMQTAIDEIAVLIGDGDTLSRLRSAQRKYVLDLFSGVYDIEYVNNRLRIGLVHKRIGVEPKLYLSAIHTLKSMLIDVVHEEITDTGLSADIVRALDKLLIFDVTLVFETYIRSLVSEIEISKDKAERYAIELEEKVRERTHQLEIMTKTDPLTGLQNVRYLRETLVRILRACERRSEPVSMVYLDVDNFKEINDTYGHQRGDEILRLIANSINKVSRTEDECFRYGGDEFCVILPDCDEQQARQIYMERLSGEIQKQVDSVTLSVGIVQTGPYEFLGADTLIGLSDKKMYQMKTEKIN